MAQAAEWRTGIGRPVDEMRQQAAKGSITVLKAEVVGRASPVEGREACAGKPHAVPAFENNSAF